MNAAQDGWISLSMQFQIEGYRGYCTRTINANGFEFISFLITYLLYSRVLVRIIVIRFSCSFGNAFPYFYRVQERMDCDLLLLLFLTSHHPLIIFDFASDQTTNLRRWLEFFFISIILFESLSKRKSCCYSPPRQDFYFSL